MIEYDVTVLDFSPLALEEVIANARTWFQAQRERSRVIGAFRLEVGRLGQIILLREFHCAEHANLERQRTLEAASPFGGSDIIKCYRQRACLRLPFLPPPEPTYDANIYEIRTYKIRPGGVPATIAAWEPALIAASSYARQLVTCLYTVDGSSQLIHIWRFDSFEQRMALRSEHYRAGTWPPRGAPEKIADAWSTIALGIPELM